MRQLARQDAGWCRLLTMSPGVAIFELHNRIQRIRPIITLVHRQTIVTLHALDKAGHLPGDWNLLSG